MNDYFEWLEECHKTVEEMYKFYDTIDFMPYFTDKYSMDVDDIWDALEKYYDQEHPELLPEMCHGRFFNYVDRVDLMDYLAKRYNLGKSTEYIEKYYLSFE